MNSKSSISFKIADCHEEMEQIHRLNYETFVEEIPQHAKSQNQKLVDRFHDENTYWIAKQEDRLIGMVAIRGKRPFSLDEKLGDIDRFLPEGANPCEVRLLSVRPEFRGNRVFFGLLQQVVEFCMKQNYNCVLISGTVRQTRLYHHLGFRPFGPLIGTDQAKFQPMLLTQDYFTSAGKLFQRMTERREQRVSVRLLPGPVSMHPKVCEAWAQPAISHRSESFRLEMTSLQGDLKKMTGSNHVQIAVGTGTMANEMVAAQLSRLGGKGLILSNGEFGERLAEQAVRWKLACSHLQKPWNEPITLDEVRKCIELNPEIRWLWTVHCETSTGYLYPVEELKSVCQQNEILLCVDACSSLGTVPIDLREVHLATGVSGKGLGSYPGLAIVFHQDPIYPDASLPAFLDLGLYDKCSSVPFTHSSNAIAALQAAVANHRFSDPLLMKSLRERLTTAGLPLLGDDQYSPGVLTIVVHEGLASRKVGDFLKSRGIEISYESVYLLQRNWIQLALMGHYDLEAVKQATYVLIELLEKN